MKNKTLRRKIDQRLQQKSLEALITQKNKLTDTIRDTRLSHYDLAYNVSRAFRDLVALAHEQFRNPFRSPLKIVLDAATEVERYIGSEIESESIFNHDTLTELKYLTEYVKWTRWKETVWGRFRLTAQVLTLLGLSTVEAVLFGIGVQINSPVLGIGGGVFLVLTLLLTAKVWLD